MSLQYVAGNTPGRDHTYHAVVNRDDVGYFNVENTATVPPDALYGIVVPEITDDGDPMNEIYLENEIQRVFPISLTLSEFMLLSWHIKKMSLTGSFGFHFSVSDGMGSTWNADDDEDLTYDVAIIKSSPIGTTVFNPCVNPIDLLGVSNFTPLESNTTVGMNDSPDNRPFRQLVKNMGFVAGKAADYKWNTFEDNRTPDGCMGHSCHAGSEWNFLFGMACQPVEAIYYPDIERFLVNFDIRMLGTTPGQVDPPFSTFYGGDSVDGREWIFSGPAGIRSVPASDDPLIGNLNFQITPDHLIVIPLHALKRIGDEDVSSQYLNLTLTPTEFFSY